MIKFKDFLTESIDPFFNRAVGMISAERGHLSPDENEHRSNTLHSELKAAGHKVTPVQGGYVENHGTPQAKEVSERSFLVMHKKTGDDNGAVKNTLTRLGKKYDQDSILHKPHNSDIASFHGTNKAEFPGYGKQVPVGKKQPYKGGQYFTQMPNGKRFTFGENSNYPASQVRESEKMKVRPEGQEPNHFLTPQHEKKAEELHNSLSNHYKDYSLEHRKNLQSYSHSSRDINYDLWKTHQFHAGWNAKRGHEEAVHGIDNTLQVTKTPHDMNVYSGTRHDPREHDISNHPAYLSTSVRPEVSHAFAITHGSYDGHQHVLNVHVPKGSSGAYIGHVSNHPHEKEFILPRNSKLKYKKTETTKYGSTYVHEHHMDLVK